MKCDYFILTCRTQPHQQSWKKCVHKTCWKTYKHNTTQHKWNDGQRKSSYLSFHLIHSLPFSRCPPLECVRLHFERQTQDSKKMRRIMMLFPPVLFISILLQEYRKETYSKSTNDSEKILKIHVFRVFVVSMVEWSRRVHKDLAHWMSSKRAPFRVALYLANCVSYNGHKRAQKHLKMNSSILSTCRFSTFPHNPVFSSLVFFFSSSIRFVFFQSLWWCWIGEELDICTLLPLWMCWPFSHHSLIHTTHSLLNVTQKPFVFSFSNGTKQINTMQHDKY